MGESMATMRKKMAAALAAVSAYMQQEEEAQRRWLPPWRLPNRRFELNLWGQSGRQSMMPCAT
jgi:hypothetical protein